MSDAEAWRHVISQSIDTYESRLTWGTPQDAIATFEDAPELTGRPGIDAGVAALAEYLAERDGWAAPAWALDPARTCEGPWYVRDLPAVRARAHAEPPRPLPAPRCVHQLRRARARVSALGSDGCAS